MNQSFPKSARLLSKKEFSFISKTGKQNIGRFLIVEKAFIQLSFQKIGPKLGITVSRQYGKANKRNRFKRLVREAFRKHYSQFPKEVYLNVRPRSLANKASFNEIENELLFLVMGSVKF